MKSQQVISCGVPLLSLHLRQPVFRAQGKWTNQRIQVREGNRCNTLIQNALNVLTNTTAYFQRHCWQPYIPTESLDLHLSGATPHDLTAASNKLVWNWAVVQTRETIDTQNLDQTNLLYFNSMSPKAASDYHAGICSENGTPTPRNTPTHCHFKCGIWQNVGWRDNSCMVEQVGSLEQFRPMQFKSTALTQGKQTILNKWHVYGAYGLHIIRLICFAFLRYPMNCLIYTKQSPYFILQLHLQSNLWTKHRRFGMLTSPAGGSA